MIKLSKLTDYAVVILAAMTEKGDVLASASELAAETKLPEPTVSKVLKLLAKGNVITSIRGVKGGYKLAHDPVNLTIHEIIVAMEGPVALTACVEGSTESCALEGSCALHGRWTPVNRAMKAALETIMLADMMNPAMAKAKDVSAPKASNKDDVVVI